MLTVITENLYSRLYVVMWLNQIFLLPEGIDTPVVMFNFLRRGQRYVYMC